MTESHEKLVNVSRRKIIASVSERALLVSCSNLFSKDTSGCRAFFLSNELQAIKTVTVKMSEMCVTGFVFFNSYNRKRFWDEVVFRDTSA